MGEEILKLIVGLGNPGDRYAATRHNVGFMVIDELSKKWSISNWRSRESALVAEYRNNGEQILLVKPQTYMNLSGNAVGAIARWYKLTAEDILVIYDDLDLTCGQLRLREKGGAGGHHGVESVISQIGENFARLKIGIGRPLPGREVVDFVLTPFFGEDAAMVKESMGQAVLAVECYLKHGIAKTMNDFNKKQGGTRC